MDSVHLWAGTRTPEGFVGLGVRNLELLAIEERHLGGQEAMGIGSQLGTSS